MLRELRQPLRLLCCLAGSPLSARQPNGQVVTEPVDVMIGPVRRDRTDRQIGPLWELRDEQPAYESCVGVYLVGVHLFSCHDVLSRSTTP